MVMDQDDERHIIPFAFEKGITILSHREPTDIEIENLPLLYISDPEHKWAPKKLP